LTFSTSYCTQRKNASRFFLSSLSLSLRFAGNLTDFLHNNEAMNVRANFAWEDVFSRIHRGELLIDFSDSRADLYGFANEIQMRRRQERYIRALQRMTHIMPDGSLTFGNKFFMTMDEEQQQSFFGSIFKLQIGSITVGEATDNRTESPAITISTSALIETLPHLHESVRYFTVSNFTLTRQPDVQALSNAILSKCRTLMGLSLESIECPVDDCHKQDSDGPDGFLDPLFYAAPGVDWLSVSTKTRSVHSTLVSPRALRALFVEGKESGGLRLMGLGLTDSHVLAIVDGLSTSGTHLSMLDLASNPGITAQGYGALLNLINRAIVVGHDQPLIGEWSGFCIDDKAWESELHLVSEMNITYSRLEYMTNGTFTSEERRWQWLEMVACLLPTSEECLPFYFDDETRKWLKKWDVKHLNFIWYTLCKNPDMMRT
jgi:hypothetical protein